MKPLFSSVELKDAFKKQIADKIGEEAAYLLEEKLSVEFRNLEVLLENITDNINEALQDLPNERNNPNSR